MKMANSSLLSIHLSTYFLKEIFHFPSFKYQLYDSDSNYHYLWSTFPHLFALTPKTLQTFYSVKSSVPKTWHFQKELIFPHVPNPPPPSIPSLYLEFLISVKKNCSPHPWIPCLSYWGFPRASKLWSFLGLLSKISRVPIPVLPFPLPPSSSRFSSSHPILTSFHPFLNPISPHFHFWIIPSPHGSLILWSSLSIYSSLWYPGLSSPVRILSHPTLLSTFIMPDPAVPGQMLKKHKAIVNI